MKSASLPHGMAYGDSAEPEWRRQIEAWRELVEECPRKPTRGRVHALRVATLRLQADIPHWLAGCGQGDRCARAAKRWNRQAEKLRRALGPVRAVDVDLGRLGRLRDTLAGPDGGKLHSSRLCLRQIDQLERRFRQQRRAAQKELVVEMAERRRRLRRTSLALEMGLAPLQLHAATASFATIREQLAALAAEFPELNEDNLHEFRMRIKGVRYLADLSAATDARAARQAAAMGRMQVAAGEWHDLKMLAKKAAHELGDHDERGGLVALLEELAAESLERALALCRRTMAQLLRPVPAQRPARRPAVLKFPPRRIEPEAASAKKIRA
ncbi:MAG: CHAD domain-containing protein [Acidobacteriota bacterium]|nr:CHAD domain-containing protein [Acidobacteriota bacterium]